MTIGRQLLLDWDSRDRSIAALRDHLLQTVLMPSDAALLSAVATLDQSRQRETYCRKSKRELGLAAHLAPTTVLRSLARLAAAGLVAFDSASGRIELLVDWQAVWSLARSADPAARIERLRARGNGREHATAVGAGVPADGGGQDYGGGPGWSGVVRGGPPPRTCPQERSKIRGSVSVRADTCAGERTGPRTTPDQAGPGRQPVRRPKYPWSTHGGYTGDELRESVLSGDLEVVRILWNEAKALEWIVPSEDNVIRWLTCVHHAALSAERPMGVLTRLVKGGMTDAQLSRIRDGHEDWARQIVAAKHRTPDLAER